MKLKMILGVSIILAIIFGILFSIEVSNEKRHNKMIYDKYQIKLDNQKELILLDKTWMKEKFELTELQILFDYKKEMINNPYEFSNTFLIFTILFFLSLLSLFLMFIFQ